MKILCICLNALFMSHEQCKRRWNKIFFLKKAKNADARTFSSVSKPTLRQQGKRPKMKEKIKPKIEATLNVIMAMVWCYG